MNCEECRSKISPFLDNELEPTLADGVRRHLAICPECAAVFEDLAAIFEACRTEGEDLLAPPNSPALWRRISNVIESEVRPVPPAEPETPSRRFWRFSLPQLATGFALIAVVSSLLTIVGIRAYSRPEASASPLRSSAEETTMEKVLGKLGLITTPQQARERHFAEQQKAIEYWNARVAQRRSEWNERTREAFDRNMRVIDQSVVQYTNILKQDPEDDLSAEMLDSVLTDKMNLLRDFSDL
ncbi:MAG: hypothetical protein UZ17_ACD001001453 [Acidobacteria bacterium OLB17]|nr:MAG: hypothetical protein UZ17_ACD001001453 [Acidobacteria bacterium OLB17]MCZ2391263.1 zf-HC2 domain-containing protein [Acidobacteriota bacterium]